MMFYESTPGSYLRLGDVITGLPYYSCKMEMKNRDMANLCLANNCRGVVLTPCCSIGREGLLTIAPLEHINTQWLKNENFKDDLCIINSPMLPRKMISHEAFSRLPEQDKAKYMEPKQSYTLVDFFIYFPHSLLNEYQEKDMKIGHYCIRFSKTFTIQFNDFIYSKGKSPDPPAGIKILELTEDTRSCLRAKMLNFYARVAE